MRYLILIGLLLISPTAYAATYEQASDAKELCELEKNTCQGYHDGSQMEYEMSELWERAARQQRDLALQAINACPDPATQGIAQTFYDAGVNEYADAVVLQQQAYNHALDGHSFRYAANTDWLLGCWRFSSGEDYEMQGDQAAASNEYSYSISLFNFAGVNFDVASDHYEDSYTDAAAANETYMEALDFFSLAFDLALTPH